MGLPIKKLILATNENNILSRFVRNGDYSIDKVVQTHSPSMDIQLASNFERRITSYNVCYTKLLRTSAKTGMKLVSPVQRGTICM